MRLIGSIDDPNLCEAFSSYLHSIGIDHNIDVAMNKDWGSDKYGSGVCEIWVIDEDKVDKTIDALEEFRKDPTNPKFKVSTKKSLFPPELKTLKPDQIITPGKKPPPLPGQKPLGRITKNIIILCVFLFLFSALTAPRLTRFPTLLPGIALISSPVNKALLYDWPKAYSIAAKIVDLYGVSSFETPDSMPPEQRYLIREFQNTPYWQGFYDKLLAFVSGDDNPFAIKAPLFEKIRAGEVWRLITPVLLHADIFHILFNMLWLYVLGQQIEERMSPLRFILFMVIVGVVSNTLQYLMSGPNFLGFSGILTGMLGFIWVRQKKAPWEGYVLQPGTLLLLSVFVLALFGIQVIAFFSSAFFKTTFTPNIANTAHLTGAASGMILGQLNFFSWRKRSS